MSGDIDFDHEIDRHGTDCEKYDACERLFGRADITPLWVADMDFAAPPVVLDALQTRLRHGVLGYTEAPARLRHVIRDWCQRRHGWSPDPDTLLITPGVVPSLFACVQAFTQPGDGVIIQTPVYPPFAHAVQRNQRRLLLSPLQQVDGRWQMDWDSLERQASQARLLLLCSPHNPVGRVWTIEELQRLLALAQRHDLLIISDEIHADLVFHPHRQTVLATLPDAGDRVITAMAPSKTFNIPGLGLSWLQLPTVAQQRALQAVLARLHLHMSHPLSLVAAEAAYAHGDAWLDALRPYLAANRDQASARLQQAGVPVAPCEGTYLLWLDTRHTGCDESVLQQRLVHEAAVGLSQGSFFGEAGRGFFRLNLGMPRARLLPAVDRISTLLSSITGVTT